MEILDALERKVSNLLDEVTTLRADNLRLQKMLSDSKSRPESGPTAPTQEAQALQKALDEERQLRENIQKRIDALVKRLEEHSK